MPLMDPARMKAFNALKAAFQAMSGPAFHFPIASPKQIVDDPAVNLITGAGLPDLPVYVLEVSPDGAKDYYPGEQLKEEFIVNVSGRMDADSANPSAKMTTWEYMHADLETALTPDVTLGGTVVATRLLVPAPFVGVGTNIVILFQPVKMTIYRAYRDATL